jgi:small nuclear ribonucleoprotein (snRNP)-like protein
MEVRGFGGEGRVPEGFLRLSFVCAGWWDSWVMVVNMGGGPADFSSEYVNCRVRVETSIGVVVEGILVEASRYWFKVRTDRGVVYVNKAHVVLVTPVVGLSGCRGGRGG